MGHTHIKTIETSRSCDHKNRQNKNRTDPVSPWMLLHPNPNNFPERDKKWKLL